MWANSMSITSSIFSSQAQFGATFYAKFLVPPTTNKSIHGIAQEIVGLANAGNPLENLFLSIPMDEDLCRTYFWEACCVGENERKRIISRQQLPQYHVVYDCIEQSICCFMPSLFVPG
jgi:hypothetical protein